MFGKVPIDSPWIFTHHPRARNVMRATHIFQHLLRLSHFRSQPSTWHAASGWPTSIFLRASEAKWGYPKNSWLISWKVPSMDDDDWGYPRHDETEPFRSSPVLKSPDDILEPSQPPHVKTIAMVEPTMFQ